MIEKFLNFWGIAGAVCLITFIILQTLLTIRIKKLGDIFEKFMIFLTIASSSVSVGIILTMFYLAAGVDINDIKWAFVAVLLSIGGIFFMLSGSKIMKIIKEIQEEGLKKLEYKRKESLKND